MQSKSVKKLTYIALLSAMAIVINAFENTYLNFFAVGIRFGLANIIALITYQLFGVKEMIVVNVMRVMVGTLISGKFLGSTFWISAGGVTLSCICLVLGFKVLKLSLYTTSIFSAIGHSIGQVFVVSLFYKQAMMAYYIPIMLVAAIPTGMLTGMVAQGALVRLKKNFKFN